ncbi:MAG: beta-lactamase family protein [Bacteroidota bacterium]|nr:beta-lactamase family protein [Bacteroidota bacterium]
MYKFTFIIISLIFFSYKSCKAQNIGTALDKIFLSYIDSGFSGVAIVVKNDIVVLQKAYGFANEEKKILNSTKTLFNVASIGKQFTAATVLKLEEKGMLNTKDYVAKYVGKLGGLKDSATIEHLLLHTSGLFVEGFDLDYSSRDVYIASVSKSPIESKPGEKHRYSNAGYNLLAAVVEIVTKEPFEDVLHKMIFQPAGMNYTGYPWEYRITKNLLATGYTGKGEAQPPEINIWGNRGPGNIVINTEDMLKWYRAAWIGDKIISQKIKERMLKDHIPGKETFSWGKAITATGKKQYYKGGGRADFQSQVMWWPEDKVFLFFSINRDKDLRRSIFKDINTFMNKL